MTNEYEDSRALGRRGYDGMVMVDPEDCPIGREIRRDVENLKNWQQRQNGQLGNIYVELKEMRADINREVANIHQNSYEVLSSIRADMRENTSFKTNDLLAMFVRVALAFASGYFLKMLVM